MIMYSRLAAVQPGRALKLRPHTLTSYPTRLRRHRQLQPANDRQTPCDAGHKPSELIHKLRTGRTHARRRAAVFEPLGTSGTDGRDEARLELPGHRLAEGPLPTSRR